MARTQVLIVGLGQFGMALARALHANGDEVIAVDIDPHSVQVAAGFASQAVAMDAMEEAELVQLRPAARDICVCAIGNDSREASIVVTAMLRQLGARRIVARATDEVHERILNLVGAHEVINPERAVGARLAARLSRRGLLEVLPLGDDVEITELRAPEALAGRTLKELGLPRRFQVTVLAVRRGSPQSGRVLLADANLRIEAGDVLVMFGPVGAAARFAGAF